MSEKVIKSKNVDASILVVGSVAYDNIITPLNTGERILGGSASYASIAASYYAGVNMVGVVGHDFDEEFINRFNRRSINLDGLQKDLSGPTFMWTGKYHENFHNRETIDIKLNVFENFRPHLPNSYKSADYVMLGNISPDLQLHVMDQLSGNPFVVADTIDLWIEIKRNELFELIKRINLFVINDSEAEIITGESNIINAGNKLISMGPECTIIKKGLHGAYLFHAEGIFALPAYPVIDLQDPTGAGDSFAGALLGYLSAINDTSFTSIKNAMLYATVTASLTVEAFSCDRLESAGIEIIKSRHAELKNIISL